MNLFSFRQSLTESEAPRGLSKALQALWIDAKDDWNHAHELVDGTPGSEAAWVHAYLHRKEGDVWNADYWYQRAGRIRPDLSLEEEWETIVEELLDE